MTMQIFYSINQWCICGHMKGEHLGSITSSDFGGCNSRGSDYAGLKHGLKLTNFTNIPPIVCACIRFTPLHKEHPMAAQIYRKYRSLIRI